MKTRFLLLTLGISFALANIARAQSKVYLTSGGETIFSWGNLEYTDAFQNNYQDAAIVNFPVRFTTFFHVGEFTNLDFNNNIGLIVGFGIRNIGMISDEHIPVSYTANPEYKDVKVVRRAYSAGIPLALKIGSFKDNFFLYAGGEYEWTFHMKEKFWDQHSRSGNKSKNTTWWPRQITTFLPSTFVGVQFPKGINLKFKAYLDNFLNHDYITRGNSLQSVVSDLSKYKTSELFYISLSWHIKTNEVAKKHGETDVAEL